MPNPLSHIPRETLAALEGVISDIDDTVTRDGRMEAEAFDAMHQLAAAGLKLIAVTGRPLGWSDVAAHLWPVDLAVGENGAGWAWMTGRTLGHGYYQEAGERAASQELLSGVRARVADQMPSIKTAGDQYLRRCDLAYDVGETVSLAQDDIDRLLHLIEETGARSTVSSVHAHAVPGDWNKALGVVRAARAVLDADLDSERDRWLFIGDSGNDAAAFAHFPVSVGVRNVEQHLGRLSSPPTYITQADRGRGFQEMAMAVLRNRDRTGGY